MRQARTTTLDTPSFQLKNIIFGVMLGSLAVFPILMKLAVH